MEKTEEQIAADEAAAKKASDDAIAAAKVEKEASDKRIKDLEFNAAFGELLSEHPAAKEYKAKIKEKVDTGLSVTDATLVILAGEGKIGTKETYVPGGTSAPTVQTPKKEPETAEEWAQQLQDLERKGEFRFDA